MNKATPLAAIFGLSALAGGIVLAQTPSTVPSPNPSPSVSATPSSSPSVSLESEEAVAYIHHVNNLEINEANNALGQLQGTQVQDLAQTLITDHQQNDQQLSQLADQKGITLFGFQQSDDELASQNALSSLNQAEFDQAFAQLQAQDHQEVLRRLQTLQSRVTDPEIRAFIAQTITMIQKHIQLASSAASASPAATPSASPSASPSPSPSVSAGATSGGTSTG
jgi:predicted outer membrane protein